MPRIIGVGTAVPENVVTQEQACEFAERLFRSASFESRRLLPIFRNTEIKRRHFCVGPEWFEEDLGFHQKNQVYQKHAAELSERAVRRVFEQTGVDPAEVGHLFFVSTTGISTPSIDAHLINRLGLRKSILRTPIWGLGCSAGIAGIVRASDWLRAYPESLALVVSVELCGLTFIRQDMSKSNFVGISLFGDGSAAALIAGDLHGAEATRSLSIGATASITWADTLDIAGWEFVERGLKVVFDVTIPSLVHTSVRPALVEFLESQGLKTEDVDHFVAHPGGSKVVDAYLEALGIEEHKAESMREVLKNYGNMSSASVLFVLAHFLESGRFRSGDLVLSTAVGPGFTSETFIARCQNGFLP